MSRGLVWIGLCAVVVSLNLGVAQALDVAVPSEFPHYVVEDNNPENQGYYFSVRWTLTPTPETERPYAFIMDPRGELVWYYTDTLSARFFPHFGNDRFMLIARDAINEIVNLIIFNPDFTIDRIIPRRNPHDLNIRMDVHEAIIDADDNLYTLWYDPQVVDMSLWVAGGLTDCIVDHATIHKWNSNDELLWEWRSVDHVDVLPYTANNDPDVLLQDRFQHLHINSIEPLADGDIVVNARSLDYAFRIDGSTGEMEWGLGGDLNQFDIFTNLPGMDGIPLDFTQAHDARMHGDTLSIFDNGVDHDIPMSFARDYIIDTDNMTAELIYCYAHPDSFCGPTQGSYRWIEDGKRLIGWGGVANELRPTRNATELDENNDIVWQIRMWGNAAGIGQVPDTYRWYKVPGIPPAAEPYLSHVADASQSGIELIANWFGHEDEVSGYDIYFGTAEDSLEHIATTLTGLHTIYELNLWDSYFAQVQPVDGLGDPVGPLSNMIEFNIGMTSLFLNSPTHTIPADGGTIFYSARFNTINDEPQDLLFQTRVTLPNGSIYGPLRTYAFQMDPNSSMLVNGLRQIVPPEAPAGDYVFRGRIKDLQGEVIVEDGFPFTKLADSTLVAGWFNWNDWDARQGFEQFPMSEETSDPPLASAFNLLAPYPNPFNETTTLTFTVTVASSFSLSVYNLLGQRVATLADGMLKAGTHARVFDAGELASGLYFVHASTPGQPQQIRKVLLVR